MTQQFDGKVALVTGGGSGIGRASALALAREDARLVVADVDVDGGEETARLIAQRGGDARFVVADVTQAEAVEALVATVVDTFGRLDLAHNNAGVGGVAAALHEYPEDAWDQVMGVNLKGVWLCMKYEIAQMLRQGGGAIVNTASIAGLIGAPPIPAYSASKHGVVGLTKTAALSYAGAGIRVNAVCPAWISTPMVERFLEETEYTADQLARGLPMKRIGTPEEVAAAVVWLCSDAASFVTGLAMPIDGGLLAE